MDTDDQRFTGIVNHRAGDQPVTVWFDGATVRFVKTEEEGRAVLEDVRTNGLPVSPWTAWRRRRDGRIPKDF